MMKNKPMAVAGNLYILSAPSGTGKSSVVNALLAQCHQLRVSISYTTRKQRLGEIEGKDYYFISKLQFEEMVNANQFLEYAFIYGNYYGTSRAWIEQALSAGDNIIVEIDWQGAQQVRKHFPQAVSIFMLPPSRQVLLERLRGRGKDSEVVIQRRMEGIQEEILHCHEFDYIVINNDFALTVSAIKQLLDQETSNLEVDPERLSQLLQELAES